MPYMFVSTREMNKRLDALFSELDACHDRLNVLTDMYRKLGYINTNMLRIYERLDTMQRAWDEIVDSVRQLSGLDESVKAAFDALQKKLDDVLANVGAAPSVAEIDALKAEINQAVADVRAAIPA